MDSIRVSEAPDPGSIPGEATEDIVKLQIQVLCLLRTADKDSWRGHSLVKCY